jgi:hypothetical protein
MISAKTLSFSLPISSKSTYSSPSTIVGNDLNFGISAYIIIMLLENSNQCYVDVVYILKGLVRLLIIIIIIIYLVKED